MILLTDEAIGEVIRKSLGNELPELEDYTWAVTEEDKAIAKEQIKNVYEWGEEPCEEHHQDMVFKRECYYCWQSLLKELE